jgi:hypothetical protein
MPEPIPTVDFTQIQFPSDGLTISHLRKVKPHFFDLPAREGYCGKRHGFLGRQSLEDCLGGIIDTERELAALAFIAGPGRTPPDSANGLGPRWEAIECLANDYVRIGLAKGAHHARELIRGIESQAAAQATRGRGPTPAG